MFKYIDYLLFMAFSLDLLDLFEQRNAEVNGQRLALYK